MLHALINAFKHCCYRNSLSESLHTHVKMKQTQTLKKLLTLSQIDVNYCLSGETPIMNVASQHASDEQCVELYDVLIQAGALNYMKPDELWYDFLPSEYLIVKSAITVMFYKQNTC